MHPLNVYGYHVRYGHSVNKVKNYNIREDVCFGNVFYNCKSKYYRLFVLKGDADLKKYHSNYCFFSRKEIINHFKQLPKFCTMKFTVTESKYKEEDAYQIDFFIDTNNRLIHKYVLTWTRTLFEWPYYLYLVHAKELHKRPEFKFESIINLFNVIASVHMDSFNWNVHTFGVKLNLLKKSDILKRVLNHPNGAVNNVFPRIGHLKVPQHPIPQYFEDITKELFEKNLPAYIEAYNIIKNEARNNRN